MSNFESLNHEFNEVRQWCSGNISAFQALALDLISGWRRHSFMFLERSTGFYPEAISNSSRRMRCRVMLQLRRSYMRRYLYATIFLPARRSRQFFLPRVIDWPCLELLPSRRKGTAQNVFFLNRQKCISRAGIEPATDG